ncbi:precorrin-3B C17-methyltransferase [Pseudomonas coronafaciens pv. porri]|uniref:Precorrin-3B C17-methyltransferase n=1 Tax=Pseudomonas coronafaciens pv. porri TaxID=83964 RepID=A0ABR5JSQ2_9PSED|nr:precorrin-3B C(17)-methyltransferase [Pseudomonas coronafaciens]KOP53786.1 precorrin-3B C17-methyltransferase [Pseudomonas coronafaciens pv. porri]KOP60376.1 precorrin-3B C17-methyltransferase [Pseudomonas coronafaciens pv. porri]RMU85632.1 CbiG protein/precorrin-3B C17-methyltransferase [Pseudomonas coronafaciens pv. porri]RMW04113.1 CbiG protein/precorrin-3B C17-methyltransferase [Pseudomonas coronafaciens pv. porri]RMW10295.1 CbiG protein/precorrin-3B C17-methyltransferase [Pseudomonas c
MTLETPAIVILGNGSLATAKRIQQLYPGALIHGLAERVQGADNVYDEFGTTVRQLYQQNTPIIALCAAGIVIRTLAPLLLEKGAEPPVLAVAEDGSAVVPLLGGLGGVNVMARSIASALGIAPAITTSGELRFGTCLLNPPSGYALGDLELGKRFVSDLLSGQRVRIEGEAPWLAQAQLPEDPQAERTIHVGSAVRAPSSNELLIYPRSVLVSVSAVTHELAAQVRTALRDANIAEQSLACLLASEDQMASALLHQAAEALGVPLRFERAGSASEMATGAVPQRLALLGMGDGIAIAVAAQPLDVQSIGRGRGRLAVIGLGPGAADLMVPAVKAELARANDVLGYETYVRMAGPFRADQVLHCTDNREEMLRARHAFELAAQGRSVVVVSSGDPGVFAMASAVLEALHESDDPHWHSVELEILPGVSASLATAAQAGAPLGHDFCVLSLSDNLKPWEIIEKRLDLACQADLALAFYNPISRSRPWQLGKALEIVRQHRSPQTPVTLGRDVGRPGQTLRVITLGELTPEQVDMRTMVLIGSSLTCTFPRNEGGSWVYTPRWYGKKPTV